MKKVKQICIDILVDENIDGCDLAKKIEGILKKEEYDVLGCMFQDDFTELYKREYPDLLEEE